MGRHRPRETRSWALKHGSVICCDDYSYETKNPMYDALLQSVLDALRRTRDGSTISFPPTSQVVVALLQNNILRIGGGLLTQGPREPVHVTHDELKQLSTILLSIKP